MTIAFPRVMPSVGAMGQSFEPERFDYLSPEAGGPLGAVTAGFPRWTLRVSLNNMSFDKADIWRAWLAVQRGPQRPFLAYDLDRRHPRFHATGRPYNAAPGSWSQAVGADDLAVLTLSGLMVGQIVAIGDYVGFSWGGGQRWALTRAVETVRAGTSGQVAVAVEPPVPPPVPSDAAITLHEAKCRMRLVTQETKLGEQGLGFFTAGSTIAALEDLIA